MVLDKNNIYLSMAVHAHQPVDNFDDVFSQSFKKSYWPFFRTLHEFPEIKISFHISGSLLDWAVKNQADFIEFISNLVRKGQLEILTAGYYEPILALISDRDKKGQILMHIDKMKKFFGFKPQGLWLTERVWEPELIKAVQETGLKFILVDDEHFKRAGMDPEKLDGYYMAQHNSSEIAVFGGSKFLRYSMPFKLPNETVGYLLSQKHQSIGAISFADDLEKFGFWPHTYEWVYEKKWFFNFFQVLSENKNWLKTVHFQDIVQHRSPTARVDLPCGSYPEMMEWSDNMFKSFLVKYPESNHLQKRMLVVSAGISEHKDAAKKQLEAAQIAIYKSQSNDVYWHGVYGGLYLTHLRYVAYKYLIESENQFDSYAKTILPHYELKDFDLDGNKELIFKDEIYNIYIAPHSGGMITEIDYKPSCMNILNTLARRPEKYHKKVLDSLAVNCLPSCNSGPVSIHDIQSQNLEDLKSALVYDYYRKAAWIDHIYFQRDLDSQAIIRNSINDISQLWEKPYKARVSKNKITQTVKTPELSLTKSLLVKDNILGFRYELKSNFKEHVVFDSEFNLLLYSSAAMKDKDFKSVTEINLEDEWFRLKYKFSFSREIHFLAYPIETVSDSESGIQRTYQGLSLHFVWPVNNSFTDISFTIDIDKI
ncbi:MAG: DUF1926 domain-containing protein [Candidatus Omnitrophica bacterium]|nr:DUF1926 domain-containing protein [Candidatus Omnitrophota bacterium]